jgi:hypothetical protein
MKYRALAAVFFLSSTAFAAAPVAGTPSSEFEYPELLVTPRSSERVASEAAKEPSSRWTTQLPIQVSAAASLATGITLLSSPDRAKDPDGVAGIPGVVVGGAWLVTTLALEAFYQPYTSAHQDLAAMPAKTPREQLIRERFAEEAIKSAARLDGQLRWLSVLTNLGSSAYMIAKAQSGSFSQVMGGVAAAFSLAPIVFCGHRHQVAHEQESYKKRIYAPIASATLMSEPGTGNPAPGAFLSMRF